MEIAIFKTSENILMPVYKGKKIALVHDSLFLSLITISANIYLSFQPEFFQSKLVVNSLNILII